MENLKIEVEETKTYKQRMVSVLWYPFIIFIILCPLSAFFFPTVPHPRLSILQGLILMLFVGGIFFSIYAFAASTLCRSHINLLEISENRVHIIYTKNHESLELNDSIEKFYFFSGISKGTGSYLKIIYNDEVHIKQLNRWSWRKEKAFYTTTDYLRKRNLLR